MCAASGFDSRYAHVEKIKVRILPTFDWEPPLRGEVAESTGKGNEFRLLGNSDYIKNNTDGFVILTPDEYEVI